MSVAQFDALLAILEPHIKKKTTNFCELGVQGSIYSALCCETKWMNLTISILDFGIRFYGGSELSKHLSKCLPRMRKTQKNRTRPEFFYDGRKFRRQCANVIDITWGRIYFSTCENFGLRNLDIEGKIFSKLKIKSYNNKHKINKIKVYSSHSCAICANWLLLWYTFSHT